MDQKKPSGRDPKTGRFLKGNSYCDNNKVKPDEPREPHPSYPWLDKKGHVLPGAALPNYKTLRNLPPAVIYQELHKRLLDEVAPTDVQRVYQALFQLTQPGEHGSKIQKEAIKLYFDRFFGQPHQAINITQTSTQTKVNLDLTSLSDEELQLYMRLQGKVQSNLELLENKQPEGEEYTIDGEQGASGEVK